MTDQRKRVYPYIPNSAPEVKEQMLREIGVEDVEVLYQEIPRKLRFKGKMDLPKPLLSEYDLRRHVEGLLGKNRNCNDNLSFLGAGCWQHFVPAVCDEINSRGEFLTAYAGDAYTDHGKFQAIFEFQSMIGELVGMDLVSTSTYGWSTAASSSVSMAIRLTGRNEILVPANMGPERLAQMRNFTKSTAKITLVNYDRATGQLDLDDLKAKISKNTAAVYFENPNYFGVIQSRGAEISTIAHDNGAKSIVGVDAISLGILTPPAEYGADIACGEAQGLGIHMTYGGGTCGFIAARNEAAYLEEFPNVLVTAADTAREGELGFGYASHDRTSYYKRDKSQDFTGTGTALWAITAGVYLSLMGPEGMREVGEACVQKSAYAARELGKVKGVKAPVFTSGNFKEFVVDFDGTGKKVAEINRALLSKGIFGGKDLTKEFPELGESALYCVTEVQSKENIDRLVQAVEEVVR